MGESRGTVVVAGASGYVGSALGPVLARRFDTIGLSRRARPPGAGYGQWRATDLFSLADAERGLAGCDRAVYLVHSMLRSDRLTQGRFEDFDLICADNFGRAASRVGIKQVIYLGGLVPPSDTGKPLSRHLASRLETERALAAHGVPLTALRAGLVIGPGGSSFVMMQRLVVRLPVMLCPEWTATRTQPIALQDVVRIIDACLGREDLAGAHDIGCPDVVSYREMMQATATALGKTRHMIPVPFMTTGLSRLWVSLITGAPKELVAPLIQSLEHPMVARNLELQRMLGLEATSMQDALAAAMAPQSEARASLASGSPNAEPAEVPRLPVKAARPITRRSAFVRSVQRLPLPPGRDAVWVAREYMTWLPRALGPMLRVETEGDRTRFFAWTLATPLLELTLSPERSTPDRQLLYVTGGLLSDGEASSRPRLEFRVVEGGATVLAAIHDFAPSLPWSIYLLTQARAHLWVMRRFGRHLGQIT